MGNPRPLPPLVTPEEYLAGELLADVRHEYVGGRVYAMAGTSIEHNEIVGNLVTALRAHLRGHRCRALFLDVKFRPRRDVFYYPDIMVCCDPSDNAPHWRQRPSVVIEVLSPETRRIDEQEKALACWLTPAVEAYILVDQAVRQVRVMRRGAEGWETETLSALDDVLALPALEFTMTLAEVYERTAAATA